ncbi:MAG TPA: hypothetical protein VD771_02980 [Gemmatimonadaceae bacterium]|nr:hypothetical protein [Gemmatimonadaceae bacterium]
MTLRTRIPIEECKARLASGADEERLAFSWSGYAGSKPILGKVRDDTFRLQKRRYYRNDFSPYFYGRFVASGRETLIEGEFKMRPAVKVATIVWLSLLALIWVAMLADQISNRGGVEPLSVLIPAGMAVFLVALMKFGQWLGRSEERAIVTFLKSTFEADVEAGEGEHAR